MNQKHWSGFRKTALAAAAAMVAVIPAMAQEAKKDADTSADDGAPRAKEDKVRLGTITIVGSGGKLAAGQMLNEDTAKSRSTVTREAIDKDRASGNPFQALALLPGVNTFNYDGTGLFGGGLTVRGFGSDQMGMIINGVPVNDSGGYAVYPQEYADQENLCTQSLAQGTPDVDSPNAGATGGNITVTSCDPEDKQRIRVSQGFGELSYTRTFLRYDTGRFLNNSAKVFVSYSHTEADKWKGEGQAKKDHIDAAFRWDLNQDNVILGSVLYNRAINNNINSISLAQLRANGYNFDFSTKFPGHLKPVGGTAQNEGASGYLPSPAYYKLANNPFENAIVSVSGSFKVAENTYLKVQPYLWYGFGNGGVQQTTLAETNTFLNPATGTKVSQDLNGDGDTLDTLIIGRASVTRTVRPGITTEINTQLGDHALKAGVWFERANHKQTQPGVRVSDAGELSSVWLNSDYILRPDGSRYQGRDWQTISTSGQFYANDNWSFAEDKGLLMLGFRTPYVKRDVKNFANEGVTADYNFQKSFNEFLPQVGVRYQLTPSQQVFMNVAKNFRAPPNFAFTGSNVNVANNVATLRLAPKAETSINTDLGYRYQTKDISLSATVFNVDFKDRQGNAYDPNTLNSVYTNIGRVKTHGLEMEAGTGTFKGFSAYASLTVQKSKVKDDLPVSVVNGQQVFLPTKGKEMTLTPDMILAGSVQYTYGPFYARVKVKRTGKQQGTLMNDEEVPAYWVGDVDAGYNFGNVQDWLKNIQLRLNVSNIGNASYRNPSSGTVVNALQYRNLGGTTYTQNANTVFYYLGAPRFVSMNLSADF
ncbi:TonB-dependent receptor [Mitsuaria sp. CC2]|jgi:iron complex outermembrane receptor protein|uniref:TonB-dependent receptor n=1 Tax=Mitsuaria sp. CC2 TaxID=3029186 RepID=UPI003B8B4746